MKRCLITTRQLSEFKEEDFKKYDAFIGVENGAVFLKGLSLKNKYYISDFDSVDNSVFLEGIKKDKNTTMLNPMRDFVDTEEAIKYANSIGYKENEIDIFVNENLGRKDHLFNVFNLARKFKVNIFGNKFRIISLEKNTKNLIKKDRYKYLSIFIFEETNLTTKGLRWNLNKNKFNLDSSTNLISNEIIDEECEILPSKQILVVQAND